MLGGVSGTLGGPKFGAWYGGEISWGKYRYRITPVEVQKHTEEVTAIHGGWNPGSAGCLICG